VLWQQQGCRENNVVAKKTEQCQKPTAKERRKRERHGIREYVAGKEPKKKREKTPTFKCENKRENPNFATKASLLTTNSGEPKK
jgi:hypothetical protein